jgi:hypothetical protein
VVFGEFGNPRTTTTGYSCDPCVFVRLCEIGHFVRLIVGYIQYLDNSPIYGEYIDRPCTSSNCIFNE